MAKPKKKTKRTKRRNQNVYQEEHDMAQELVSRYAKKRYNKNDRHTPAIDITSGQVLNPIKHDPTIQRAIQGHLSKLNNPDEPSKFVARRCVCALCGFQSCYANLGDLYGPYFVTGIGSSFPDYLPVTTRTKSTNRSQEKFEADDSDVTSDIWLHGNCALWTSDLILYGGKFPRLTEILQRSWKEKCRICKKVGASISVNTANNAFVHFPCAQLKDFQMIELTLTCRPPLRQQTRNSEHN
ncbi:hypothetical protein M3Y94_00249800 [Aphelenchoides besseyi]|nr:hypothetical protein M3Y94_00249800 [Aphelenchoides besseyi]KAI6236267.1 hypothetical protein M3Y95_00139200 [Aphelenchoides besseyi]